MKKRVIFCDIAWMKYYNGGKNDTPQNGGKYIKEHKTGGEIDNFLSRNHYCYGYVMSYGDELHIERFDRILKNHSEVNDVTVVWVATKDNKYRIVGWYEHATMYRYRQIVKDYVAFNGTKEYNFKARDTDCYLIKENHRDYVIPRAAQDGTGRGMGRSQVWYAESPYAQNEIIPGVLEYLESVKNKAVSFPSKEVYSQIAKDKGQTVESLIKTAKDPKTDAMTAIKLLNLALQKKESYDARIIKAHILESELLAYSEASSEYKKALIIKDDEPEELARHMYVEWMQENYKAARAYTGILYDCREALSQKNNGNWNTIAGDIAEVLYDSGDIDGFTRMLDKMELEKDKYGYDFIEEFRSWIKETA